MLLVRVLFRDIVIVGGYMMSRQCAVFAAMLFETALRVVW